LFLAIAFQSAADDSPITAQDVLGGSRSCQIARKEIEAPAPPSFSCPYRIDANQKLKKGGSDVELSLVAEREKKAATAEIKKRLIQNAVANFAQSVARAKQMTGADPLASAPVQRFQDEMQKKCGGSNELKSEVDKLLTIAKKQSTPAVKSDDDLNRYIVAILEYKRIEMATKDKSLPAEEKEKLVLRKNKIAALYPMAVEGAPLLLRSRLEYDLQTSFTDSKRSGAGAAWMDDYLFQNKETPAADQSGEPYTYQIAKKLKARPLSDRAKKEVINAFSSQLMQQMKSIGDLCKADACTTFNISHELTAQSLRRRQTIENIYKRSLDSNQNPESEKLKFTGLQKQVCDCHLLEPQKVVNEGLLTGMSIGTFGGLVFCVFIDPTKLSCPVVAAASVATTVGSAANTTMAVVDAVKVESAVQASANLPGLADGEKAKLTNFQRDRALSAGTDVALTVAGAKVIKVATPVAKKVVNKVINRKAATGEVVEARGSGAIEDHVTGGRNPTRQHYVDNYGDHPGSTPDERLSFKTMEEAIRAAKEAGHPIQAVVRSVENSIQKFMNTITNDFAFVNAINNRRDAILRAKYAEYMRLHPNLKVEFSTDWKGFHTIAHGNIPSSYDADISKMVSETYAELTGDLVGAGLMRSTDRDMLLNEMNHSGYGQTFDQAGTARKMDKEMTPDRSVNEGRGGRDFNDPDVQENHRVRFQQTEMLREGFENKLGDTALMRMDPQSGKKIPVRDLYTVLKKSDDPAVLKREIKKRFNVDVDENTAANLKEYSRLMNDQSPNLVPAVNRESATLVDAEFGGISSDTVAMNTRNLEATSIGAARATDNINSLSTIRQEEQKVTGWLNNQVNPEYRDIAQKTTKPEKVLISGDEKKVQFKQASSLEKAKSTIFGKPVNEEKLKDFVRAHAADDPSLQRHTYIQPGVPRDMRDPMTEHGHTVQKYLMEILEDTSALTPDQLKNMNGLIMMDSKTINNGGISIIIGQKPGTPKFTAEETSKIRNAFLEAIKKFNQATKEKPRTNYTRGRVIMADE
jgi:hypothetical protein